MDWKCRETEEIPVRALIRCFCNCRKERDNKKTHKPKVRTVKKGMKRQDDTN